MQEKFFSNSYSNFVNYVQQKFDSRKRYAIQNYSNFDGKYIYNVKIFDDFLATGLTNQEYRFQEEKITASYDKDNNIVFSVGNYIQKRDLQYMAANDYLIVNVNSVQEKYSFSIYEIEFTNKSDYTVVIKDGNADGIEVALNVEGEYRACNEDIDIVLEPGEHRKFSLSFSKFYDTDYQIEGLVLSAVRIMENYTGSEESAKQEIENAVDKFSMTVAF